MTRPLLVLFHVGPGAERSAPFTRLEKPIELTRVPLAGELVSLGKDEDGVPADFRVMLVRHLVRTGDGEEAVAEIYARRVWAPNEVAERAPRHQADAPWRRGAKLRIEPK